MSSFKLKLIAITTMLIDHIGVILFPEITILRMIGRLAFPLFAFFISEGYRKTSDLKKYILRLSVLAVISQLPFWTAFGMDAGLNIFFTLVLGLIGLYLSDKYSTAFPTFILAIIATIIKVDYGFYGVLLIYIMHITRNNFVKMFTYFTILLLVFSLQSVIFSVQNIRVVLYQLPALISLLFIKNYNGKLGYSAKDFFYLFYPVHLMVLPFIEKVFF